jgi:hypothetical protein
MDESLQVKNLYKKLISSEYHFFPKNGRIKMIKNHGVYIIYDQSDRGVTCR